MASTCCTMAGPTASSAGPVSDSGTGRGLEDWGSVPLAKAGQNDPGDSQIVAFSQTIQNLTHA
eukprot:3464897-Amphidinium_carterae.1